MAPDFHIQCGVDFFVPSDKLVMKFWFQQHEFAWICSICLLARYRVIHANSTVAGSFVRTCLQCPFAKCTIVCFSICGVVYLTAGF